MNKEYTFDFSKLTALDAAKIASLQPWKIFEVVDKCIIGGLISYEASELPAITNQFSQQYTDAFHSHIVNEVSNLLSKLEDAS